MKYFIFILIFSSSAYAENINTKNHLKTLFTSPGIRAQLDKQRRQGKFTSQQQVMTTHAPKQPITVKMQGIVLRKNKPPVVFVNNNNTLSSRVINEELVVKTNKIKQKKYIIPVRVINKTIKLKPGQQWNDTDRKIKDNYEVSKSPIKNKPDSSLSDISGNP